MQISKQHRRRSGAGKHAASFSSVFGQRIEWLAIVYQHRVLLAILSAVPLICG
jgi:hypothetical protein